MHGAILGDIVGSPYEFDCNNCKSKDFPLLSRRSGFTDDTVMTLAVARALLSTRGQDDAAVKSALVREMQRLGRAYPDRGYGVRFAAWLREDDPLPYRSYGNGKDGIRQYVEREFGYALGMSCDDIRPGYRHVESCRETVPQAICAFLESTGFEDALRTAVSLGGDSDTLAAITGSIAEAFFGVPEELKRECRRRLPRDLAEILCDFESAI